MDWANIRNAFVGPGMDTRQWVSYGTVVPDTPDGRSVSFDAELGPLVRVKLEPEGTEVICRVAMGVAGDLEGEYFPFVAGDEVVVVIPEGAESAVPVIIARLCNGLDKFPTKVAGQDTTKNNFAFKRIRPPYIVETANGILFRHAGTGAQLGLDTNGQVIFNDASGSQFFFGADAQGFTSADGNTSIQMLANSNQVAITAGNGVQTTNVVVDGSQFSILSSGQVKLGSAGFQPIGHGLSAEQVLSLLYNSLIPIAALFTGPGPPAEAAASAAVIAALGLTSSNAISPAIIAALNTSLTVPPDPTGQKTGFGRAGVLV